MPTKNVASSLPNRSFAGPESSTWRCEASWPRNANCVKMMPSAAAISSWNQEAPKSTTPAMAPANASTSPPKSVK